MEVSAGLEAAASVDKYAERRLAWCPEERVDSSTGKEKQFANASAASTEGPVLKKAKTVRRWEWRTQEFPSSLLQPYCGSNKGLTRV